MFWPPTRHLRVARGLLPSLILIAAVSTTSLAAGLKRAARTGPEQVNQAPVARPAEGPSPGTPATSQQVTRTLITGPTAPAPLGSAYQYLVKPGVAVAAARSRAPGIIGPRRGSDSVGGVSPASAVQDRGSAAPVVVAPVVVAPRGVRTPLELGTTTAGSSGSIGVFAVRKLQSPVVVAQATPDTTGQAGGGGEEEGAVTAAAALPSLPAAPDAEGEQLPGPLVVTPESAARMAIANSIDLAITAANIREAEAQVKRALGLDDVRLSASAMYGRHGPVSTMTLPTGTGETFTIQMGDPDIRQEELALVKPLYTKGKIQRAQDLAIKALETRRLSTDVVKRALDSAAREVAYGVLRMQELTDVTERRASAVAAHLDLSKKLMDAGVVARFEVVQAETELARAQGDVIGMRTRVETAKAGLRRILTVPQETDLEVTSGAAFQPPPGDQTDLIQRAWRDRPEIRTGAAAIKLSEANVRLAAASRDVSVSLTGGLTHTHESGGADPWGWQIGVAVSKPIFDGREEEAQVGQAVAQLEARRLDLENTKQQIAQEVTEAQIQLGEARELLRVAQEGVVEAKERLRIAQVRYENGIALGIEVLDAQTALAAADVDVTNSQYGLQLATVKLRSSVGLWGEMEGGEAR